MIIVADEPVMDDWRNALASWIYDIGSRYVIAWGHDCEEWHDAVDLANLEAFDFGEVPAADAAMTTWHHKESLSEVFWFAGSCAHHPIVELPETMILHISNDDRGDELLAQYRESLATRPDV